MNKTPFIEEILSQADVLQQALGRIDLKPLGVLTADLQNGKLDRIVLTGMGASLCAAYPAWLLLAKAGLPACVVDAAELVHYTPEFLTSRTLLWVISQSGRSAELLPLLEIARERQCRIFATVNDLTSPLAQAASVVQPVDAPAEKTVSTRTYVNSLAAVQLAALELSQQLTGPARADLERTAQSMGKYLQKWEEHVRQMEAAVNLPRHLVLLGRGPSLAAAQCGALILGESAKMPAFGLNAAEFRHGPLEMAGPELTTLIFAGETATQKLHRSLMEELLSYQTRSFWLDAAPQDDFPFVPIPQAWGIGLPLAEILPIQLLTIALANLKGIEAGKFFRAGKITLKE